MTKILKKFKADEFARRIKSIFQSSEHSRYVFFLGAGCSISSGIPNAAELVKQWLRQLKHLEDGKENGWEAWASKRFPGYSNNNPAAHYGAVIEDLFLWPDARQQEIERLTASKYPGFGYGALAQLMSHKVYGHRCHVVLTTNFDDLVADALYLYSHKKPLVVAHESLAKFARLITRFSPLIVKLHGDAHLAPKNTPGETSTLDDSLQKVLKYLLNDAGVIFCGYGGNDQSILDALKELPPDALPGGVYWVGAKLPDNSFKSWLESRDAVWVEHFDFDKLMVYFHNEFALEMPTDARFREIFAQFRATFEKLSQKATKVAETESSDDDRAFQAAVEKFRTSVKDWWGVVLEANEFEKSDPEKANQIYLNGLVKFPNSPELLGSYAGFLNDIRKDYDQAERYYQRALEADQEDATSLSNYAGFLNNIRKDYDQAEPYYQRALEADPEDANTLGNYAVFLQDIRKDYDQAEPYYQRALEADPNQAIILGNYALFLKNIRKDYDQAEPYYQRALEADPNQAIALGNYAGFILAIKQQDKGWEFFNRSEKLAEHPSLKLELQFYTYAHHKDKQSRNNAFEAIKLALFDDIRSPNFDLSANVERAIADGHPEPKFLAQLATVISDEAKIETLDSFDVWKNSIKP